MHNYKKGFRAEHELIKLLTSLDYAVLRAPKSGRDTIDVIACKRGAIFAFECKSWATTVRISERQMNSLTDFSEKAGAIAIVAIKQNNEGWRFLKAQDVRDNNGVASDKLIEKKAFSVEFFSRY
ncbi:MAG: Holliday junction resolvase Hjc [Candidatus Aenigmatarchaeota archaeon]